MAYDTVSDLIKAFREDEKDAVAPYFWSDAQLVRFANEALTAYAEKTKSIFDDSSPITEMEFEVGDSDLPYAEQIIDVIEAVIVVGTRERELAVKAPGAVRRSCLPKNGSPQLLIVGGSTNRMKLVPAAVEAGKVLLSVVRRPLKEATKDGAIPDVPASNRSHLLLFIKHKAYGVQDSELFDPVKARSYEVEFDRKCQSIYEDTLLRLSVNGPIKFRWL